MTRAVLLLLLILGADPKGAPPAPPLPPEPAKARTLEDELGKAWVPRGDKQNLTELLDNTVKRLARIANEAALRRFEQKDYPGALKGFEEAHDLDPSDPEITNNLAYLYQLLGNRAQAERFYRMTIELDSKRGVAYLNLADLLSEHDASPERHEEAAGLLTRARELRGNDPRLILRQARVAAKRSLFEEAERFYREHLSVAPASDALRLELGDLYREYGHDEDALRWYREIDERESHGAAAARRIFELEVAREARRLGWVRPTAAPPAKARSLAARGRALRGEGRLEEAERLLLEAVTVAPGFAAARADLGGVLADQGRPVEAELAYLRALALAPGNADIRLRLADLYAAQGGRAAEEALMLERVVELRPDWSELHLRLAEAHRATGELARALIEVRRYLVDAPEGPARARAAALEQALAPLVPDDPKADLAPPPSEQPSARSRVIEALIRARAFLSRGESDAAMAELRRLPDEARGTDVLNLEARILFAANRLGAAAAVYEASLEQEASQPSVREQLGLVFERLGRHHRARRELLQAESMGNTRAIYHLARLDLAEAGADESWLGDLARVPALLSARDRLDAFLLHTAEGLHRREAETLRVEVGHRLWRLLAGGAGVALILVLALALALYRTYGGTDLRTLLARHPDAGPEVQRILSAIRHEVLKHNTMVLTGVVAALDAGEDATEAAHHVRRTLFGPPPGEGPRSPSDAAGVFSQLMCYVVELEQIGRARGVRLNLRRRDPAVGALLEGFGLLRRSLPQLDRVELLGGRERTKLRRRLAEAARLLNTDGYQAVCSLLDEMRALQVGEPLLRAVFERTRGEPAFSHADVAPLALEGASLLPRGVLVPAQAFEDITANLLRNAIESTRRDAGAGDGPIEVGMGVRTELDTITGVERVVFEIRDRSPRELTTEMLRGGHIEEGLGLTAELVTRYEGSLEVTDDCPGWSKAVVVKLPAA